MHNLKEKFIVRFIKIFPIALIIILSAICAYFLKIQNKTYNQKEIETYKTEILNTQKLRIRDEAYNAYNYIEFHKQNSEETLKKLLKDRIYEAYSIVDNIYNKYKDTRTKEEILELIKVVLNDIKFLDGRGYFFIYDTKGNNIFHGANKSFEGKNFWNYKDLKGRLLLQDAVKTFQTKDEMFDAWYWSKPNSTKEYRKIGFHKLFKPYNIFIGTGEYVDDFEKNLKNKITSFVSMLKYGNNGYIYLIDKDLNVLTSNNGKKLDTKLLDQIQRLSLKGEGFLYSKYSASKIFYVKKIKEWDWGVVSFFYKDELDAELNKRIEESKKQSNKHISSLLLLGAGLILLMLLISIYITSLLEKSFKNYRKKIEEVMQRNREKDAQLSQQSKMAAMGEMIGNIAHQWRQPLSLISTIVTGLKFEKEMDILKDEDFYRGVDKIHSSVNHLSTTIDDFRDFFNPHKQKTIFDAKDVFDKTLKLLNPHFDINNIYFVQDIKPIKLYGLENELIQVMINLLNNARDEFKKSDDEETKRLIFISTYEKDGKSIISVKDTAGGIDKKTMANLFRQYFTTKGNKGTGIGLYMSKQIIENSFGGKITVKNSKTLYKDVEYEGAEFILSFDKLEEEPAT